MNGTPLVSDPVIGVTSLVWKGGGFEVRLLDEPVLDAAQNLITYRIAVSRNGVDVTPEANERTATIPGAIPTVADPDGDIEHRQFNFDANGPDELDLALDGEDPDIRRGHWTVLRSRQDLMAWLSVDLPYVILGWELDGLLPATAAIP